MAEEQELHDVTLELILGLLGGLNARDLITLMACCQSEIWVRVVNRDKSAAQEPHPPQE